MTVTDSGSGEILWDCENVGGARADLTSRACQASYVGVKMWQIQVYWALRMQENTNMSS